MRVPQLLLDQSVVVIYAGGGGITVLLQNDGSMVGVEAVIDRDASSALLPVTDVDALYRDFGTASAEPIPKLTVTEGGGVCGIGRLNESLAILNGSSGTKVVSGYAEQAKLR